MSEHDARISQLERDQTGMLTRLDGVEEQQRATWAEIGRMRWEQREEFNALMKQQKEDTDKLSDLIRVNKVSAAMMTGGARALAWGIGTLIALGSLTAGAFALAWSAVTGG